MKRLAFLVILAAVVGLFAFALTREQTTNESLLIGKPAPAFEIPLFAADSTVSLAKLKGKPVVLNFWASWCLSCRDEARVLEAGWKQFGPEVAFVGVAVSDKDEDAKRFIARYGKTYYLGPDVKGSIALDYGLYGVPETFFISPEGVVLARYVGPLSQGELADRVASLKSGEIVPTGGDPNAVERFGGSR